MHGSLSVSLIMLLYACLLSINHTLHSLTIFSLSLCTIVNTKTFALSTVKSMCVVNFLLLFTVFQHRKSFVKALFKLLTSYQYQSQAKTLCWSLGEISLYPIWYRVAKQIADYSLVCAKQRGQSRKQMHESCIWHSKLSIHVISKL